MSTHGAEVTVSFSLGGPIQLFFFLGSAPQLVAHEVEVAGFSHYLHIMSNSHITVIKNVFSVIM